jgi:hypothetical protein
MLPSLKFGSAARQPSQRINSMGRDAPLAAAKPMAQPGRGVRYLINRQPSQIDAANFPTHTRFHNVFRV